MFAVVAYEKGMVWPCVYTALDGVYENTCKQCFWCTKPSKEHSFRTVEIKNYLEIANDLYTV